MKKIYTLAALLFCFLSLDFNLCRAQDIHFSQFYENAILRNPALTGIFSGDYKAGLNYRSQWGGLTNPFRTVMASAETRMIVNKEQHDYLSFGLCISYDRAGAIDFNSTQITPAINYNKSLNDRHAGYLSAGFAASYIQRSVDPSKMTLDEQYLLGTYTSTAPNGEQIEFSKISHYDVSAGLSFNSSFGDQAQVTYYIGGAAYHILKPKEVFNTNEAFIRLSPKYTGNIGVQVRLTGDFGLALLGNYTNQHPYQETIFGSMLSWRKQQFGNARKFVLYAGCFVRTKDAVIPTVKVDYNTYSFTTSYDVTTSSLKPALSSKGGWEFSLYIRGQYNHKDNMVDQMHCPRFEQGIQTEFDMQ